MRGDTGPLEAQLAAVADVLGAISASASDAQPVFDTIVRHAARLCAAEYAVLWRLDGADGVVEAHAGDHPRVPGRGTRTPVAQLLPARRVVAGTDVVHIPDMAKDPEGSANRDTSVFPTRLGVAIRIAGELYGWMNLVRTEARPFSDEEIELVRTFARQAAIAIENVRLFNETKDALERQTAVSEILRVIAGSPTDVQPVLDAIADGAARFCGAENVDVILQRADGLLHPSAHVGTLGSGVPAFPLGRETVTGRSMLEGHPIHIEDLQAVGNEYPLGSEQARAMGHRTTLATPLMRGGRAFGAILLRRADVRPFTEKQVELVRTFADQAVIAIENVRLFNETKEALERQTAIGDILRVISASPTDLGPVLDTVAESAVRFCGAEDVSVMLLREDGYEAAAHYGPLESSTERYALDRGSVTGRAILELRTVHAEDVTHDDEFPLSKRYAEMDGQRTVLVAPLIREGKALGAIALRRGEPRPFTERQIALARTFADQAVIAIENVRLFNETKEALERETAVGEILKVISASPDSLQPVFDAIAAATTRFCAAEDAAVMLVTGGIARPVAHYGLIGLVSQAPLDKTSVTGTAILEKRTVQVEDVTAAGDFPLSRQLAATDGWRTALASPLVRAGETIGAIVLRRKEPRAFTDRQVELVETFADQAVIAIENVRLFNETKEALEQQTAVADVLQSMSRSTFDLQHVLETLVEQSARLCDAERGSIHQLDGEVYRTTAFWGDISEEYKRLALATIRRPGRETLIGRVALEGAVVHMPDVLADPEYTAHDIQGVGGYRTMLGVPLLRDGIPIGVFVLTRQQVRPFSDRQIELVRTFADQAVIAIENVRLFNETKEALEQQTATAEVLRVISQSTFDVQPVLDAVVQTAGRLARGDASWLRRLQAGQFTGARARGNAAEWGATPDLARRIALSHGGTFRASSDQAAVVPARVDDREERARLLEEMGTAGYDASAGSIMNLVARERQTIHLSDITAELDLRGSGVAYAVGARTVLAVPLIRQDDAIGYIVIARTHIEPFTEREVALVETFAGQAGIAIENVTLFNEIEEKSRQLEIAGRHKSEFLANMSHELRTPLNAIIGFSEVLLQGMFGALNEKQREYQQDVLSSGRLLLSLINDILDLSKVEAGRVELELGEFSLPEALENGVTMIRERASRHGIRVEIEVDGVDRIVADERKVKQVVLNLLTNAVKFTRDGGRVDVRASRENGEVRVAVRDTGIGIEPADRERIFEEFQQASRDPERSREGTGLGLALSKRYVELHGGRIWVESEVGRGSTFTFALPLRPARKEG